MNPIGSVQKMNLKNLKTEEERAQKRLQKYKKSLLATLSKHQTDKEKPLSFQIKFSELNRGSWMPKDNSLDLQLSEYKELIESCQYFSTLYKTIVDYKAVMWEKKRIFTLKSFNDILDKIIEEMETTK